MQCNIRQTRYMQYIAVLSATLSATSVSIYVAWSSPSLPKLESTDSPIGITLSSSETSWIASTYFLGVTVSGIVSAYLMSKCGPKITLLLSTVPTFASWLAVIFAKSAVTLYIARFVGGVATGVSHIAVPIYISEIASTDIRGRLGTFLALMKSAGTVFVYSIGPFVSYTTLAMCCSLIPVVFGLIFLLMPESPYYLIKNEQYENARINLIRLYPKNVEGSVYESALQEIRNTVEHDTQNPTTIMELFGNPAYRKSLILMTGIKILQQFCGLTAIESYLQTITEASKSSLSPEISSVIFGCIPVISVLLSSILVDGVGRKPLMVVSALGSALALSAEGVYYYIASCTEETELLDSLSWLPTTALVLYLLLCYLGINNLPYVLLGEIFPSNVKHYAVSVFISLGSTSAFLSVTFFKPIVNAWGLHTIFWIYSVFCTLGAVFLIFVLPETKGKTFLEIQKIFNSK